MIKQSLIEIYELLYNRYGPQHWWPGETTFEIIIGAILTQNTNWQNVEKAINNLKQGSMLDADKLHEIDIETLAAAIRPAGYYNIKAGRLKNFLNWLFEKHNGNLAELQDIDTETLRGQLLRIKGVGKETADSILLYAFERPVFVVDAYTYRVMSRHQLIDSYGDYEELRYLFEHNLPADEKLYNEFHALLVCVGKNNCKPRPKCQGCPLEHLPHDIETM